MRSKGLRFALIDFLQNPVCLIKRSFLAGTSAEKLPVFSSKASFVRILTYITFCLTCSELDSANVHLESQDYQPEIVSHYKLLDIGETEIDPSKLSKFSQKMTLAPSINNSAQGIGNRQVGGFSFLPLGWEYSPQIKGMKINFHALNNSGDILVTLLRSGNSLEWMVWPREEGGYANTRRHVETVDPFESNFYLTSINNAGQVVGYREYKGKNQPIIWSQATGIRPLGKSQGLQLQGIARAINGNGSVVGVADEVADRMPFFWNEQLGLEAMKNYRSRLEPKGWVEFADMVLTDDDVLYGTFWIKHLSETDRAPRFTTFFAYYWAPRTGKIVNLDLQGMRLADINSSHRLVGSLEGKAALRDPGHKPILLANLIDVEDLEGWELLEATSINDQGQIAGYGTFEGKTHLFLAEPTSKKESVSHET